MKPFDPTSLDGYELNILEIADSVEAAIHKHEFINTDGALMENMGMKPRQIKFKCFFYNQTGLTTLSDYVQPTYDNHYDFVNLITDSSIKIHNFVHPKYGAMDVLIDSIGITHNDTQDYVEIDLVLSEMGIKAERFVSSLNLDVISAQVALLNAQLGRMNGDVSALNFSSVLNVTVNPALKLANQMRNVTGKARNFIKECDDFIAKCNAVVAAVTSPLNTVNSLVSYVGDLPSVLIGTIQNTSDRVMHLLANLSNLPATFTNNATMALRNLGDSFKGEHADFFKVHFASVASAAVQSKVGSMLIEDEKARSAKLVLENTATFDKFGNRVSSPAPASIYTVQDVESSMFASRDYIQYALNLDRSNQQLQDLAAKVIAYVDDIKLKKRSVVTITTNSLPLHLLCTQMGLSYQAAERVLAINPQIKNPTFAQGKVKMYVS